MSEYVTYGQDEIKLIILGLRLGQNSSGKTEHFHYIVRFG